MELSESHVKRLKEAHHEIVKGRETCKSENKQEYIKKKGRSEGDQRRLAGLNGHDTMADI